MYSFWHIIKNIFKYLVRIPQAIFSVRRMSKPWPFFAYEAYLDMPLSKIRKEFNIYVL